MNSHPKDDDSLDSTISKQPLAGIQNNWHSIYVGVLSAPDLVLRPSHSRRVLGGPFCDPNIRLLEWNAPQFERETEAYYLVNITSQ